MGGWFFGTPASKRFVLPGTPDDSPFMQAPFHFQEPPLPLLWHGAPEIGGGQAGDPSLARSLALDSDLGVRRRFVPRTTPVSLRDDDVMLVDWYGATD